MNDFWIDPDTKEEVRCPDNEYWAKLRVKEEDEEQYIDILMGKRGEKSHMHMGINLNQTLEFNEERGLQGSISRKVESEKHGLVSKEMEVIDKDIFENSGVHLRFELEMDGKTREVSVKRFEIVKEKD